MHNRRKLIALLGVAGTGSVVWQKPAVSTVTLPAHAITTSCNLDQGCYEFFDGAFFEWEGGFGPYDQPNFRNGSCTGELNMAINAFVLAESVAAAEAAYDVAQIQYGTVTPVPNQPSGIAPCVIHISNSVSGG